MKTFRNLGEVLTVVAYCWTIYAYFKVGGILAAILSMGFPFLAPTYGFLVYTFTDRPEIASSFVVPNVLNIVAILFIGISVFGSDKET